MSICKSDANLLGGHPEMIKLIIFENVGSPASRPAKEQWCLWVEDTRMQAAGGR